MAARVDMSDVQEIMDIDATITNIDAFITAGNLLINNTLDDGTIDEDLLTEIERWLVAHLVTSMDPRAKQEKHGDDAVTYQGKFGMKLEATMYGQNVLLLDPTGKMARLGLKKASLAVVNYAVDLT